MIVGKGDFETVKIYYSTRKREELVKASQLRGYEPFDDNAVPDTLPTQK